jgi:hypothetical protein
MPVDARIALGVEPVKMPDFAQLAVQRSAVMNNMAEMASKQRALNEQNTLAQLMQDPSFSFDNPESRSRVQRAAPNLGGTVLKSYDDAQAAQAEAKTKALSYADAQTKSMLTELFQYRDFGPAETAIDERVASGLLTPEQGTAAKAKMRSYDKYDLFAADMARSQLTPAQMLQQDRSQLNTGTEILDRSVPTFSPVETPMTVIGRTPVQMSPSEQAAANVAARVKLESLPADSAGVTRMVNPLTGKVVQEIQGAPPATGAAAADKKLSKAAGIEQFNTALSAMRNAYVKLDELGGLVVSGKQGDVNPLTGKVDPAGRSMFENMNRFAAASEAGQYVQGATGDPKQTERDNINNLRFALINSIKTMQDVGAKSLDSNVELQNALKTLSNPSQSRESVASTLATIDKIFRAEVAKLPDDAAAGGAPTGVPKEIQDILNLYPNKR